MLSPFPYAVEQLSPCSATTELVLWSPGAAATEACAPWGPARHQEKPPQRGAGAPQREWPLPPKTRESQRVQDGVAGE